jgi:hypothetical protein
MGQYFDSPVSPSDLTLKFIEHLMANIDRYYNARFAMYGLYFAIIGTVLTIYFTKNINGSDSIKKRINELFIYTSIIGQIIIILQLIISFQIEGNYATLNLIFNKVDFISKLSQFGDDLRNDWHYYPIKWPFALPLIAMYIANIALFYFGCRAKKIRKYVIHFVVFCITVLVIGILSNMHSFSSSYKSMINKYLKTQIEQVEHDKPDK